MELVAIATFTTVPFQPSPTTTTTVATATQASQSLDTCDNASLAPVPIALPDQPLPSLVDSRPVHELLAQATTSLGHESPAPSLSCACSADLGR